MELQHIKDDVYYLSGIINIGVVAGEDGQAILIDSGLSDRSGRRILQALEAEGLRPVAVLNTHCHGDHSGGNAYLVEKAGVRVYAPLWDAMSCANLRGALSACSPGPTRSRNWLSRAFPCDPLRWMLSSQREG